MYALRTTLIDTDIAMSRFQSVTCIICWKDKHTSSEVSAAAVYELMSCASHTNQIDASIICGCECTRSN